MSIFTRLFTMAAQLVMMIFSLAAQMAVGPMGHWEGTIQAQALTMRFEIDIAKNAAGALVATFSQPVEGIKGLPVSIALEGRTVRIVVKGGSSHSTFEGALSTDGQTITGDVRQGEHSGAFVLTRKGEATVVAAPTSTAVGKELEGTWKGTLANGERDLRVIVSIENHPDGTATGTIVSPDGSGIEIPIGIVHKARSVTVSVPSVGASYVGELNAASTEISGEWTQGASTLPLILRRFVE